LVYVAGPSKLAWSQLDLVLVERDGTVNRLDVPHGSYGHPRASPDRKKIAVELENGKETFVYTYDLSGSSFLQRLTFDGQQNRYPIRSRRRSGVVVAGCGLDEPCAALDDSRHRGESRAGVVASERRRAAVQRREGI
jgi:hypothetical protein